MQQLTYILRRLADLIETYPDGFTISSDMTEVPTKGYAVAVTQNCFGLEGLGRVLHEVGINPTYHIGGWLDKNSGLFYFDAVRVVESLAEAKKIAAETCQLAIFDLENGIEIRL